MSVSASDRARIDEQQTKTRDEYETRESETVSRKNNEIKNAEIRHSNEIKKLTENFQNQVDNLQRRSSESLNSRDISHRKNVEELKSLYTENMRKKNQQTAMERKSLTDTFKGEISKDKEISSSQRENMLDKQTEEIARRDVQFDNLSQRTRQKMTETIDNNSSKLKNAHEAEKELLLKDKTNTIVEKNREMNEVKKTYKGEITGLKRQKENQDRDWQEKYYNTVSNHNEMDGEKLISRSSELQGERESIQDHYQNALRKKEESTDIATDNFKGQVNDRLNDQVRSREGQIQLLKERLTHDVASQKKLGQLEKKTYRSVL